MHLSICWPKAPRRDEWAQSQLRIRLFREIPRDRVFSIEELRRTWAFATSQGHAQTAEQFRHLIGFLYLLDHPGDYETVRQFLGHTNISTTINCYAGMEMQDAAKALDKAVRKRREELAAKGRRSLRSGRT